MSGELELEKWVLGKPIRTADSNTHATGTHTHIRIPAHMWQGKLNRRRQHVLQVIYFYVFVGGRQCKGKKIWRKGKHKVKCHKK